MSQVFRQIFAHPISLQSGEALQMTRTLVVDSEGNLTDVRCSDIRVVSVSGESCASMLEEPEKIDPASSGES